MIKSVGLKFFVAGFIALFGVSSSLTAAENPLPVQREANTSLRLPQAPPQFGYSLERAFGEVALNQPVCLVSPPGETNRLFVLEKGGNIVVITNLAQPTRTVFMSLNVLQDGESG